MTSKDELAQELKSNLKQQAAIVEKFSWSELTNQQYIEAEHRLKKCQSVEQKLRDLIGEVCHDR
jgi:hypothetical protein